MTPTPKIKFNNKNLLFFQVLRKRVDEYFKVNNIPKHGDNGMYLKVLVTFSMYFIPYFIFLSGTVTSSLALLALAVLMGVGMACIGLAVMHDANHSSFSKSHKVNKIMSYSLNLIGGHSLNWKIQHNDLHHTYTNIEGHDEDISPRGILRFSPHSPHRGIHKYQFIYAWFLYGLMTLTWVLRKDFVRLKEYEKMGLLKARKESYSKQLGILVLSKILYLLYMIVIPVLVTDYSFGMIISGFLLIHFTGGLLLGMIFQPAHVVLDTKFPLPDESGNMENDWAVHQLYTTANFCPDNKIFSWFVGGLNYQVEHHLFPGISHQHYRSISQIVKSTAEEFNIPYNSNKTFSGALASHTKMLYNLGRIESEESAESMVTQP